MENIQADTGREKLSFKLLVQLFAVFFKIGLFTFGGGLAMLPMLTEELSVKKHWVSRDELIDYFAIGQCTPGIIAVNVATFVGYKKQSVIGAVCATLGMIIPSILVITVLALFFSNFADAPSVKKAFSGINIAVAALLTKVVFTFIKKAVHNVFHALITAAAFAAVVFFRVHTVWIIAAGLITGLFVYLYDIHKVRRKASACGNKDKEKTK